MDKLDELLLDAESAQGSLRRQASNAIRAHVAELLKAERERADRAERIAAAMPLDRAKAEALCKVTAADERERCAIVCDELAQLPGLDFGSLYIAADKIRGLE